MEGELLDFQGSTLSLPPGAKPIEVSLSLPLDSAISRGSKAKAKAKAKVSVKVSVVGRGSETDAVSSTGVYSMSKPSGRTLAMGAKGVAVSGASV